MCCEELPCASNFSTSTSRLERSNSSAISPKDDLIAVKAGGDVDQLHLQAVVRDLLLADVKGLPLLLLVVLHGAAVVVRGHPYHRAQGLDDGGVLHLVVALGAGGELHARGGLHDHLVPHPHLEPSGVKIIILASAPKADADHFCQRIPSNSTARAPSTCPAPTLYAQSPRYFCNSSIVPMIWAFVKVFAAERAVLRSSSGIWPP